MAQQLVTSDNLSPLVLVIAWLLCIIQVLSTLARAATKVMFTRAQNAEDWTSLLAMMIGVAQAGIVTSRASNGLGKHFSTLTSVQISSYFKATYAGDLLYFVLMGLSEVSVLLLVWNITPVREHRIMIASIGILILAWSVSGFIVSAAQCTSPNPWDSLSGHCIDRTAFWNYVETVNLLINLMLVVLPVGVICNVKFATSQKWSLSLMFSFRITVCAACACKLVYWNRQTPADPTFSLWPVAIASQTIQALSITSYSFLYLKPFFETLETGFMRTDELRRRGQTNFNGSYNLSQLSSSGDKSHSKPRDWKLRSQGQHSVKIQSDGAGGGDGASVSSQAHIVRRTSVEVTESPGVEGEWPLQTE